MNKNVLSTFGSVPSCADQMYVSEVCRLYMEQAYMYIPTNYIFQLIMWFLWYSIDSTPKLI